jgi:uncharacterized protein YjbI with pentapeptide repeats
MTIPLRPALAVLLLLAVQGPAAAQNGAPPRLALIDVAAERRAPDTVLAAAATAVLRRELKRYDEFQLLDSIATNDMAAMHATAGRCATVDCARVMGSMLGVRWVAWSELSNPGGQSWQLTTSVLNLANDSLIVPDRKVQLTEASSDAASAGAVYLAQRIAEALGARPQAPGGQAPVAGGRMDADEVRRRLAGGTTSLSGQDLSGLDLSGVDFRRVDLTKANLTGSKLVKANLFSCDLTDAVAAGADFTDANLDGTTLRRANFRKAVLRGASMFATIIEAGDLSEADLRETRIIGYLKKAILTGADFRNANIGADPGNQSMGVMRAQFSNADLSGANLSGANLYKADFSFARLVGARLNDANLRNSELVQADLTQADVTGADVAQADLAGAIFTGAIGFSRMKGLAEAKHRDQVVDAPAQ